MAMFSSPENSGDFDNSPLPLPPPPPPYATSSFYHEDHDEEKEPADQEEYASNSFYHDEEKEPDQEEYASSSFYHDEDKEADQEEREKEEDLEEQHYLAEFPDDLLMELKDDEDEEDEEPAQKQQNCNFGYKFRPTDYELIVHYLIKKILDQPLPCNRVVDDEDELLYRRPPKGLQLFFFVVDDEDELLHRHIM